MATLSVRCPHCQAVQKVNNALAGQATTCQQCGLRLLVPSVAAPPIVNAPPVVPPTAVSTPTPKIQFTPRETVQPLAKAPGNEPSPNRQAPARKTLVHIAMLVCGVAVLAITMLVLLRLTEHPVGQP